MEVYLVRHAVAEDRESFAEKKLDDSQRPLTLKGRKKQQKISLKMIELIGKVDLIVTSPYVRARETAEILAQIFYNTKVEVASELVPESPPSTVLNWLKAHCRGLGSVILVGHEPQISNLVSYFLTGHSNALIEMKKSGVACFHFPDVEDVDTVKPELRWLVPPKIWDLT